MEYTSINNIDNNLSRKKPRISIQFYVKILPIINCLISLSILALLILTTLELKNKGNQMGDTVDSMSNDINNEINQINSDISNISSNVNYIITIIKQYLPSAFN